MSRSREAEERVQEHNLELRMGDTLQQSRSTAPSPKEEYPLAALTEFLDLDDRPTLILDLDSTPGADLIYYNASLGELKHQEVDIGRNMVEAFGRNPRDVAGTPFLEWAKSTNELFPSITYNDIRWSSKTIRHRWRVITGTTESSSIDGRRQSISLDPPRLPRQSTAPIQPRVSITSYPAHRSFNAQFEASRSHQVTNITTYPSLNADVVSDYEPLGRFDMTGPNPHLPITSYVEFFKAFDWGNTAVGPIKQWSPVLRRMCNFMILDPRPAAIYYGKDKITIYNESYVMVTGNRHPFMLGKPFREAWSEIQEAFLPEFDNAAATGKAFVSDNSRFYIERHGYIEETYYSISVCPFDLEDGEIAYYNPIFDTTRQVIADRRMDMLLRVGQKLGESRDVQGFWDQLMIGLIGENPDIPFALLYSASGDADVEDTLSVSSGYSSLYQQWDLEGSINVPESVTQEYGHFGLDQGEVEEFLPNFKLLVRSNLPTLLRLVDGSMPTLLSFDITLADVNTQRCESAVFLPIRSTGDKILGFLLVGVNPRKRYDDDYVNFIELLNRQLETSMASILLLEEQRRSTKLLAQEADREKNALAQKIEAQRQEAFEIESRFRRMADLAPVGMFHIDVNGIILYANNDYYDLTEHPRDVAYPMSWYNVIHVDDHPTMDKEWARLIAGENVNFELRLKRPFITGEIVGGEKVEGSAWIIAAAYAEKDINGKVVGVLGCITDISRQKWAEGFQNRRKHEAIELKRTQESFMDMISHEMRNPLSAIIQSADWIATNISSFNSPESTATMSELIETYADTIQTIILCADHTTRIINDVLTLSKLDSDLLIITPVETQPTSTVSIALKMFREEAVKKNIDFGFSVEQSYFNLAIDFVQMDPSRLLQVLINLTTNAIKFTHPETIRKVSISLGASLEPPLSKNGIHYLPRAENNCDMSEGMDWGEGQTVYISVQVQDTGRGLSSEEISLLFKRFSQSSRKTHVQYGGSGLGLFISRRLTELQGGQIGVASEVGVGSTFAFFVKARRCTPAIRPTLSIIPSLPNKIGEQKRDIPETPLSSIQNGSSPGPATENRSPSLAPENKLPKPSVVEAQAISKHVLVVEDNIVNQKILAKQLRFAGCTVHVTNHGEEALAFLKTSQCWESKADTGVPLSVVLMDLEMPVMDGLTCVKVIRKLQTEGKITCHLPVIAVTANARIEQIQVAKAAGMDGVVTKPFRIREIMPVIEKWALAIENASS